MSVPELQQRLEALESKMDQILLLLQETHKDARRMDGHISAVESFITQFQRPAFYVKSKIEQLLGSGGGTRGSPPEEISFRSR